MMWEKYPTALDYVPLAKVPFKPGIHLQSVPARSGTIMMRGTTVHNQSKHRRYCR